jgi:hypothetical protein
MPLLSKLLIGLNLGSTTTISVSKGGSGTMPDLVAYGRDSSTHYKEYNTTTQSWDLPLPAGDYVVVLELEEGVWFSDDVNVEAPSTVNFVYNGPLPEGGTGTMAWADTDAATTTEKDPWPPPTSNRVTLAPVSQTWFHAELAAARAAQVSPRSAELGFE